MLKIRDDIDLKELEKYGFNKIRGYISNKYYAYLKGSLRINLDSRYLQINDAHFCEYDLDVVYDLIKANLVEKVESDCKWD